MSHNIALALRDFLGDVIQELKPFLSSEDIRKGARWRTDVGQQLADTNFGILCLTKDNLTAPWILFEAGALSKNLVEGRVTALLAGIKSIDVREPLSQFQHTTAERGEVLKLLQDINQLTSEEKRLPAERLERAFGAHWSRFKDRLDEAMEMGAATPAPERDVPDMVSETLELVREMKRAQDTPVSYSFPMSNPYLAPGGHSALSVSDASNPVYYSTTSPYLDGHGAVFGPAMAPPVAAAPKAGREPTPEQQRAARDRLIRAVRGNANAPGGKKSE